MAPVPVWALQALSDESLSEVTGQDGITVLLTSPTELSADSIDWRTDNGGFDINGDSTIDAAELALDATLRLDGVSVRSVNSTGSVLGASPVQFSQIIDADADELSYQLSVNRVRLRTDNLRVNSQPAVSGRSFGTWALDAPMSMTIVNRGLFNSSYDGAYVRGEIGRSDPNTGEVLEYANLFYRQAWHAHSYMTMHDFHALWEMPSGVLGIDNEGILWRTGFGGDWGNPANNSARTVAESDLINIALDFEYLYKFPVHYNGGAGEDFVVTSNDRGIMHFGWLGSLKDVELRWRPGGTWYGQVAGPGGIGNIYDVSNKSGGLNLSATWDYVDRADALALGDLNKEFRWQLGETSDVCPDGICAPGQDQSRINFELRDWTIWGTRTFGNEPGYPYANNLHSKPAPSHFPLIAIDTINGAEQGAGGFCWGFAYNGPSATCAANNSQFINVQPGSIGSAYDASLQHLNVNGGTAGGIALHVRDGQLQTFSRRVRLLERNADATATQVTDFNWGLIYSLANVDASFYLYPGGNSGDVDNPGDSSRNYGVIADITLMSQTFDEDSPLEQGFNWEHGTHLLIADTDMDGDNITGETRDAQGIGFASTSFLLLANDTRIMVKNHSDPANYYEGGLDFASPTARFNYTATFGGGVLPDNSGSYGTGPRIVRGAIVDLNIEGAANLRFSPSTPAGTWSADGQYFGPYQNSRNYLGYSAVLRVGELGSSVEGIGGAATSGPYGSYLSLAEPSRPDVAWRFANVRGDIAFTNGMIDLRGTCEDAGSSPSCPSGGDGKPKMVLANNMLIGAAAAGRVDDGFGDMNLGSYTYGGASGRALSTNLMLGDTTLGTAIIPSARVYSSITLSPQ